LKLSEEDDDGISNDSKNIEIDKEFGIDVNLNEIEVMFYSDCKTV